MSKYVQLGGRYWKSKTAVLQEFFGRPFQPEEIPLAWHHPEIILICVFVGGKVSSSAIAPAE